MHDQWHQSTKDMGVGTGAMGAVSGAGASRVRVMWHVWDWSPHGLRPCMTGSE